MLRRDVAGWLGLAGLLVGSVAPAARAVEFRVRAETVGDAYQLVTSNDEVLNRRRIHQYLGLDAYDLTGDRSYALSLVSLFRFDGELAVTVDEEERVSGLRPYRLSAQALFLEARRVLGGLVDARMGRFLHADPIDFMLLDGGVVTVHTPWFFGVELLAGAEAKEETWELTSSQLELDGVRHIEGTTVNDRTTFALGAALVSEGLPGARARFGYRRLFSDGEIDQEKVGGALTLQLFEQVLVRGTGSYDFYSGRLDRVEAGARWRATEALSLDAQYVRLLPTFDADSIFNIFRTGALSDLNARARIAISRVSAAYAGALYRLHGDGAGETEGGWGVMAGFSANWDAEGRFAADVSHEGGQGGERTLGDLRGMWAPWPEEVELDLRLTVVRTDDALQPNLNYWGAGYEAGARYVVDERAALGLAVEHNFSRLHPGQLRVQAVADLGFWL